MKSSTEIYYIRETLLQSVLSDLWSFMLAVALIGTGKYLESSPMQWLGFCLFWITLFSRGSSKTHRLTPQAAADQLKKDYGVTAQ